MVKCILKGKHIPNDFWWRNRLWWSMCTCCIDWNYYTCNYHNIHQQLIHTSNGCKVSFSKWPSGWRSIHNAALWIYYEELGNKVYKLKKTLYWLKKEPWLWNKMLDKFLRDIGFIKCIIEHGVYVRKTVDKDIIMFWIYVDDVLMIGSNEKLDS